MDPKPIAIATQALRLFAFAVWSLACSQPSQPQRLGFSGPITGNNSIVVNGALIIPRSIAPQQITASTCTSHVCNNYSPADAVDGTGYASAFIVSQDADADYTITGFDSTGLTVGFEFDFHNVSSHIGTLAHLNGGSTSANQMSLPNLVSWPLSPGSNARIKWEGSAFRVLYLTTTAFPDITINGNQVTTNAYTNTTHYEWRAEHLFAPAATGVADGPFACTFSGTGAGFTMAVNPARLGAIAASTGTATNGRASCNTGTALGMGIIKTASQQTTLGIPTLDDGTDKYAVWSGLIQTAAAVDQSAGCGFLYDHDNTASGGPNGSHLDKLSCWCASAGSRTFYLMDGSTVSDESFTTVNAPVAARTWPSTNILNLNVVFTVGTRAEFYVNNVKSCDITQNLPSGTTLQAGWSILKSAGTNARTVEVDFTNLVVDQTAVRPSP
jgi:hypothetical protein